MMPRTLHGLDPMACVSALQKCVRRAMEREAMEFACELAHTSKAFFTMVCNRLEIIAHEDIGLADMAAVQFASTSVEQAKRYYDPEKPGKWRMMIGNAIRALCRAAKSREGDHFQAVVGYPNRDENKVPVIPDFAFDMHTIVGIRNGKTLSDFRAESAKLVGGRGDVYEDEAYEVWKRKHEKEHGATIPAKQREHLAGRHPQNDDPGGKLF